MNEDQTEVIRALMKNIKDRPFSYEYPRPAVTVDSVIFRYLRHPNETRYSWEVLLIKRGKEPFKDCWAFPGGFLEHGEDLSDGARRELREETGLTIGDMHQVGAYGAPGRDPRGHTITVAFVAWATAEDSICPGDDAVEARWFDVHALPLLAFDHRKILIDAIEKSR